jgi:hypothetical protein
MSKQGRSQRRRVTHPAFMRFLTHCGGRSHAGLDVVRRHLLASTPIPTMCAQNQAPVPLSRQVNEPMNVVSVAVFVCACGHEKRSHRPHGGRRVPRTAWVCRKAGCECVEYGAGGVTVKQAELRGAA